MTEDVNSNVSPDEDSEYFRGESQMGKTANFGHSPTRVSRMDPSEMQKPLLGDYEEKKVR